MESITNTTLFSSINENPALFSSLMDSYYTNSYINNALAGADDNDEVLTALFHKLSEHIHSILIINSNNGEIINEIIINETNTGKKIEEFLPWNSSINNEYELEAQV